MTSSKYHRNKGQICARDRCGRPAHCKGLCKNHYNIAYQASKRRETREKLREMRYGKGARKGKPKHQFEESFEEFLQYSFESARWRDAQEMIALYLRRYAQGQTLYAQPAWGTHSEDPDPLLVFDALVDHYVERTDRRTKRNRMRRAFHSLPVVELSRRTATTIANHLRWQLALAQESVQPKPSDEVVALAERLLEEWG